MMQIMEYIAIARQVLAEQLNVPISDVRAEYKGSKWFVIAKVSSDLEQKVDDLICLFNSPYYKAFRERTNKEIEFVLEPGFPLPVAGVICETEAVRKRNKVQP